MNENFPPTPDPSVDPIPHGPFKHLRKRVALTIQYLGWRTLLWRAVTFPLRYTPLRRRVLIGPMRNGERAHALRWYKRNAKPVTIVIPTYGDPSLVAECVRSIRDTTSPDLVRIVVSDDASPPEHVATLKQVEGIDHLILAEENGGFSVNANRGIRAADSQHDIVLINSDIVARWEGWLAALQHAAHTGGRRVGIVGAMLLYADGKIQHAGVHRNIGAPEWFDHRYRFQPATHGPANVAIDVLAVTGACMYVLRDVIDEIGLLDEEFPMAYEDVDWCLRAWQAGRRVVYQPAAVLEHPESATRGSEMNEREKRSQDYFWEKWGDFFDNRNVRTPEGKLRVIYVTEGTGVGGGHRDIFEHLNRLVDRGHDARLFTLGDPPDWFSLEAPVHSFGDYEDLIAELSSIDAIKVATWWNTSVPVWLSSVVRGVSVYFVQDIETSYYPDSQQQQFYVLARYRHEFKFMTISKWNAERLREMTFESTLIPPGIDLTNFRPMNDVERRNDMVLALGRGNPLKNLPLTIDSWKALRDPKPELCMFGIEPEVTPKDPRARYVERPSDEGVNELFCQATVFVQTSTHEGFCLPPLEAMATGGAVVCTDAHGNRDFCVDGENCLMPEPNQAAVTAAIQRLIDDPELRRKLGENGIKTAAPYAWEQRIDELEKFYEGLAQPAVPAEPVEPS